MVSCWFKYLNPLCTSPLFSNLNWVVTQPDKLLHNHMSQSHHWRSVLIVLILTAIRSLYISELLLKFPQNSGYRFYVGLCAITAYWRVIPGICWLFMLMQLFSHEKLLRTAGITWSTWVLSHYTEPRKPLIDRVFGLTDHFISLNNNDLMFWSMDGILTIGLSPDQTE